MRWVLVSGALDSQWPPRWAPTSSSTWGSIRSTADSSTTSGCAGRTSRGAQRRCARVGRGAGAVQPLVVAQLEHDAVHEQADQQRRSCHRWRVGLTAEGQYYGGKLGYLLGVYNGGEERTTNRAGLAYGARLESAPLGPLAKLAAKDLRVHLGAGFVLDQGPSVTTTALSGDLTVQGPGGWGLFVEYLMDTRAPLAEPILPASLPGTVERNVLIVEGAPSHGETGSEVVARWEQYDNNKALTDHGDQNVITGGANLYFKGHDLKLQLNHIHRIEREGVNLDNDVLLLGVAAAL